MAKSQQNSNPVPDPNDLLDAPVATGGGSMNQTDSMNAEDLAKMWNTNQEPEGTFRVTMDKCELTRSKEGQPMIMYEMTIVQPSTDLDGVKLTKYDTLSSPQRISFVKRNIAQLLGRTPSFADLEKDLATLVGSIINIKTYTRKGFYSIDFV